MLNFAEQTGSGAVMLVWSFPLSCLKLDSTIINQAQTHPKLNNDTYNVQLQSREQPWSYPLMWSHDMNNDQWSWYLQTVLSHSILGVRTHLIGGKWSKGAVVNDDVLGLGSFSILEEWQFIYYLLCTWKYIKKIIPAKIPCFLCEFLQWRQANNQSRKIPQSSL